MFLPICYLPKYFLLGIRVGCVAVVCDLINHYMSHGENELKCEPNKIYNNNEEQHKKTQRKK